MYVPFFYELVFHNFLVLFYAATVYNIYVCFHNLLTQSLKLSKFCFIHQNYLNFITFILPNFLQHSKIQ